jgi:hypothetical protein
VAAAMADTTGGVGATVGAGKLAVGGVRFALSRICGAGSRHAISATHPNPALATRLNNGLRSYHVSRRAETGASPLLRNAAGSGAGRR